MKALEEHGLPSFGFAHYGEKRDVDATDEEQQVYRIICDMANKHGCTSQIGLVRKSKDYVAAAIGDYDIARIKFTERAKWIIFPYAEQKAVKHQIQQPCDVEQFGDLLEKSLSAISKWQG